MRESAVERYLVQEVERLGGRCPKWTSPGTNGVMDRIAFIPRLPASFIETKRPGKDLEGLQIEWAAYLSRSGFRVEMLDSVPKVSTWIAQREKELHALGA